MNTSGFSIKGRPLKRWIDDVKEILSKYNTIKTEAKQVMQEHYTGHPKKCIHLSAAYNSVVCFIFAD